MFARIPFTSLKAIVFAWLSQPSHVYANLCAPAGRSRASQALLWRPCVGRVTVRATEGSAPIGQGPHVRHSLPPTFGLQCGTCGMALTAGARRTWYLLCDCRVACTLWSTRYTKNMKKNEEHSCRILRHRAVGTRR